MAVFNFDGSANITATKDDTVVISASPSNFSGVTSANGNTIFNFLNGKSLTVTGTTYGDNTTQYPNITLAGGTFSTGAVNVTSSADNVFSIGSTGTVNLAGGTGSANGLKTVFGGLGLSDSVDGNDTINIGGKGSFLIYGNAGDDAINQAGATAFDSTSFVTTFGGKGVDTIAYTAANTSAKFAVYGGEGGDTISVTNTGTTANAVTTIFGGQGAADSTDGADTITFLGGGTVNVFGNAGADTINLGAAGNGLDSTTVAVIHGGRDGDTIAIQVGNGTNLAPASVNATISVFGDENNGGTDTITVAGNSGTTVIYGGTSAADSADGVDVINYSGSGTATIYAAGGNDTINLTGNGSAIASQASTTTVFAGNGTDAINITNTANVNGTISVTGGAGADTYTIGTVGTEAANPAVAGAAGGTGTAVTITDFALAQTGGDVLRVQNGVANAGGTATTFTVKSALGATSLQQALDLATQTNGVADAIGSVSAVVFGGDAYVVRSGDAVAGFSQTVDLAVKLTGVTDLAALSAQTQII